MLDGYNLFPRFDDRLVRPKDRQTMSFPPLWMRNDQPRKLLHAKSIFAWTRFHFKVLVTCPTAKRFEVTVDASGCSFHQLLTKEMADAWYFHAPTRHRAQSPKS